MSPRKERQTRGESAWLAAKAEMARRNDEARERGAERHAAYEAARNAYRLSGERREAAERPQPPSA